MLKWDMFWDYIDKVWIKGSYDFNLWNITDCTKNQIEIQNKTTNGLENFNGKLGDKFSSAHQNIHILAAVLLNASLEYVEITGQITKRGLKIRTRDVIDCKMDSDMTIVNNKKRK